jgi:hypothetical protein
LTTVFVSRCDPRDLGGAAGGDGVGLVEEEDGVLLLGQPEHGGHVLGRLAEPHRLELGVADQQQPLAERVGDGLGADRLTGARRAGEVEGERGAVGCRSPRPHSSKISSWVCTCVSASSSARRVAGGRTTSRNVRRGSTDSMTPRRPRPVKQVGVPVMLVGVAIDGFAFKALADAWAAAPAAERQIIVVAADAVVLAETAVLHAWVTFFLGVPFLLFGAAFVAGGQYPRWLGWLGAAGGAGCLASGASGFLRASFVLPFPVFGTLVLAFTVLAGFYLLRAGDNGVVAAAARPYRVDSVRAQ